MFSSFPSEEKKIFFFFSLSYLARVARVHPLHVPLHERDVLVVALPPRVAVERPRVGVRVLASRELVLVVCVELELLAGLLGLVGNLPAEDAALQEAAPVGHLGSAQVGEHRQQGPLDVGVGGCRLLPDPEGAVARGRGVAAPDGQDVVAPEAQDHLELVVTSALQKPLEVPERLGRDAGGQSRGRVPLGRRRPVDVQPEADGVSSRGGDVAQGPVEDRLELRRRVRVLVGLGEGQELDVAEVDAEHEEGLAVAGRDEVADGLGQRVGRGRGGGHGDRGRSHLLHLRDVGGGSTVPRGQEALGRRGTGLFRQGGRGKGARREAEQGEDEHGGGRGKEPSTTLHCFTFFFSSSFFRPFRLFFLTLSEQRDTEAQSQPVCREREECVSFAFDYWREREERRRRKR